MAIMSPHIAHPMRAPNPPVLGRQVLEGLEVLQRSVKLHLVEQVLVGLANMPVDGLPTMRPVGLPMQDRSADFGHLLPPCVGAVCGDIVASQQYRFARGWLKHAPSSTASKTGLHLH